MTSPDRGITSARRAELRTLSRVVYVWCRWYRSRRVLMRRKMTSRLTMLERAGFRGESQEAVLHQHVCSHIIVLPARAPGRIGLRPSRSRRLRPQRRRRRLPYGRCSPQHASASRAPCSWQPAAGSLAEATRAPVTVIDPQSDADRRISADQALRARVAPDPLRPETHASHHVLRTPTHAVHTGGRRHRARTGPCHRSRSSNRPSTPRSRSRRRICKIASRNDFCCDRRSACPYASPRSIVNRSALVMISLSTPDAAEPATAGPGTQFALG